jgi:hypothetical protein
MDAAAEVACSVKGSSGSNRTTSTRFAYSPELQIAGWRGLYFESCTPGKQLVGSTFTLAFVTGQRVTDISHNVFADLG